MSEYSPLLYGLHNSHIPAPGRAFDGKDQEKSDEDQRTGHDVGLDFDESMISHGWLSTLEGQD